MVCGRASGRGRPWASTPRLRAQSYDESNGILLDRRVAYAKAYPHPEQTDRTVGAMFEAICDPWHYVPVPARKPGALRNGAPFKDRVWPQAIDRIRRKLAGSDDGDRQMAKILAMVLSDGLPVVESAWAERLIRRRHHQYRLATARSRAADHAVGLPSLGHRPGRSE